MTIAELAEDRVVEAVYAVRSKRKLRTKSGTSYLALELVDATGQIQARVWKDVELLDGRFGEGDAVRVLGRVEKFRDRLQLDVRSLEATDVDPASLTPMLRRDGDELAGFLEFLVAEISHPGLAATVSAVLSDRELATYPATPDDHHSYAGGLLEHTVGVATLCRETAQLHPRLRPDLLLAAAILHDVGRTLELARGPAFTVTDEGRLLGHVHLGLRLIEARAEGLNGGQLAEFLHCIAAHHDARAARTAEAAVLYHANQLDAIAATRRVD
jgi:3'-5' exoribonuclease